LVLFIYFYLIYATPPLGGWGYNWICILICLTASTGLCRSQQSISGYVYDKESGEPLIGASIATCEGNWGTFTNNSGYFYLNIPQRSDSVVMLFSCIGYYNQKKVIKSFQNRPMTVLLNKQNYSLNEIVVGGRNSRAEAPGNVSLSPEQIRSLPNFMGDPDILKSFQLLPGIQQGTEGQSGLIVRGGGNDQNLFLLDDIPMYYVSHLGSFTSVFDASAIKQASLYKGFFPAAYGGRLSSIMDIRLKDGDLYKSRRELTIGTLVSKFFCEGPIKEGKTSYMLSTRFCNLGLFMLMLDNAYYTFYDVNAKVTHRINDRNKLYFTLYSGADMINSDDILDGSSERSRSNFGDNMSNIRWFHVLNSWCSSNTIVSYSNFHNIHTTSYDYEGKKFIGEENKRSSRKEEYRSSVSDLQLKHDVDFLKFTNHEIKGGLSFSFQRFTPQVFLYQVKDSYTNVDSLYQYKLDALQSAAYIGDKWKFGNNFHLTYGLRFSAFTPKSTKSYLSVEPRIGARYDIADDWSLHLGYSRMSQSIHLLSNNNGTMEKDLWVPSTDKVSPEKSQQWDAEVSRKFGENYKLTVGAYYKQLSNLIDFLPGKSAKDNWEDAVETGGTGINRGIEFMLAKETGRLSGHISCVLSKATMQFDNINDGKKYPFKYDSPHQINIMANYKFTNKLSMVATWTYHTGYAFTMAFDKYPLIESDNHYEPGFGDAHIYDGKNNYRMPAYHRLDVGLNIKNKNSEWHIGLYNAYNRMNPYYYFLEKSGDNYVTKQRTLFPILPSVSWSWFF
jgi:outer membrane receptor protein involved in Fe transport